MTDQQPPRFFGQPIPDEVPVWETGTEVARTLLRIAEDHGHSPDHVRAFEYGFMVPKEVAEVYKTGRSEWVPPAEGERVPAPGDGQEEVSSKTRTPSRRGPARR